MIYQKEALGKLLKNGWGELEDDYFWSIGHSASIVIPVETQENTLSIQIECAPYLGDGMLPHQQIQIFCNGLFISSNLLTQKQILFFELAPSILGNNLIKLDFLLPTAVSPTDFEGADKRMLAMKISEVTVF